MSQQGAILNSNEFQRHPTKAQKLRNSSEATSDESKVADTMPKSLLDAPSMPWARIRKEQLVVANLVKNKRQQCKKKAIANIEPELSAED